MKKTYTLNQSDIEAIIRAHFVADDDVAGVHFNLHVGGSETGPTITVQVETEDEEL